MTEQSVDGGNLGSSDAPNAAISLDPLLDWAPCGFLSFSDDGVVLGANATLLGMLGHSAAEVVGGRIDAILSVGARIFYQTHLFPMLRLHGAAEEIFLLLRARDGEDVAVLANAIRREREGRWVSDVVFMRVRERRKFEDALLRAKQAAEEAHAAAELERNRVAVANEQLEQQAIEMEVAQEQLLEQAEELEAQSDELRIVNDALMERGEELGRMRDAAEEANRAKSTFLAMMSHELRTPLNAIGGYVQLLEMGIHGEITEAQADALSRISRSQRHLLRLINEVLNLARIEAGRVEYMIEPVVLTDAAQSVLPMVEPQMRSRGLTFQVNVPPELAGLADREKLQQILLNLLSNATKFTPTGGHVSLDASALGGVVAIRVHDTGVGIAPERLGHVFEPFVQVDASPARRAEGTGLGLAISRDLARGMNGDLRVESEIGRGSTFTLLLPVVAVSS